MEVEKLDGEKMLKEIREDLVEIVERITPENYIEAYKKMGRYRILLKWLCEFQEEGLIEVEREKEEGIKEIYDTINNVYIGKFQRKLLGGNFGTFSIFVPEKTVRDLELQDGDWVRGRLKYSQKTPKGATKNTYDFEVVKRAEEEMPTERCEIKFAVVEWEDDLKDFYITDPKEEGLKTKILVPERNVEYFNLEKGDIVDYAYYENNKLNGRVIWKYPIDDLPKDSPKTSNFYKKQDDDGEEDEEIVPILEGLKIAVVGYESMKNVFEKAVVERGGEFKFFTGDESTLTLQSQIKDASRIILFPDYVAHNGMYEVKEMAKEHDIAISYPKRIGKSGFIRLLENLPEEDEGDYLYDYDEEE